MKEKMILAPNSPLSSLWWSAPQVHIRDFFVKTDLNKDYKDATLNVCHEGFVNG